MNKVNLEPYKEEIIYLYTQELWGAKRIGQKYGCLNKPIFRILKENNIPIRKSYDTSRKYNLNEDFLNEIDTPEKAYILGLFYADGSNNKSSFTISFGFQEKDKKLLYKIKQLFDSEAPIIVKKQKIKNKICQNCVVLNLCSKKLCEQMEKLGAPPNKTWKINWPVWLRDDLYSHFIRGYFDGDGCITPKMEKYCIVSLVGNENFTKGLLQYLKIININFNLFTQEERLKVVQSSNHNEIKKFLDYIYKDSTIHLQRKYDRYYSHFYEGKPIIPYSQQQSQDEILNNIDNKNPNPETGGINLKDD